MLKATSFSLPEVWSPHCLHQDKKSRYGWWPCCWCTVISSSKNWQHHLHHVTTQFASNCVAHPPLRCSWSIPALFLTLSFLCQFICALDSSFAHLLFFDMYLSCCIFFSHDERFGFLRLSIYATLDTCQERAHTGWLISQYWIHYKSF